MKKTLSILAILIAGYSTYAQTNTFPPDGSAGIGTTTPSTNGNLTVVMSPVTNQTGLVIQAVNNGGPGSQPALVFENGNEAAMSKIYADNGTGYLAFQTNYLDRMYIINNGNVGIGTITPDTKLAVNGTIHAKEVKVDSNNWPDYVFKPDYDLLPLTEIKTYIDKNQHLPDISSAQQIESKGMDLGEINKILIKKIEELTLHLIQQNLQLTDQQKVNKSLQDQINNLAQHK